MPTVHLTDRAIIFVSGPDAEHFLQNIVTTDLEALEPGEVKPGALLSPQGKILFDFLISRAEEGGFRLECRSDTADDFVRRLMLYKLRAKVEIAPNKELVAVSWETDSGRTENVPAGQAGFRDLQFSDSAVIRFYASLPPQDADPNAWHSFRIQHGIAESGSDYQLGDAFPHDVLLDQTGGVGFKKGCYVGQEVVSRMQHRGTARRRVLLAEAEGDLPATGSPVTANGKALGTLGSTAGRKGLVIVRTDRVKDAIDGGATIMAGDVSVRLSIPAWARFTFPDNASVLDET